MEAWEGVLQKTSVAERGMCVRKKVRREKDRMYVQD